MEAPILFPRSPLIPTKVALVWGALIAAPVPVIVAVVCLSKGLDFAISGLVYVIKMSFSYPYFIMAIPGGLACFLISVAAVMRRTILAMAIATASCLSVSCAYLYITGMMALSR